MTAEIIQKLHRESPQTEVVQSDTGDNDKELDRLSTEFSFAIDKAKISDDPNDFKKLTDVEEKAKAYREYLSRSSLTPKIHIQKIKGIEDALKIEELSKWGDKAFKPFAEAIENAKNANDGNRTELFQALEAKQQVYATYLDRILKAGYLGDDKSPDSNIKFRKAWDDIHAARQSVPGLGTTTDTPAPVTVVVGTTGSEPKPTPDMMEQIKDLPNVAWRWAKDTGKWALSGIQSLSSGTGHEPTQDMVKQALIASIGGGECNQNLQYTKDKVARGELNGFDGVCAIRTNNDQEKLIAKYPELKGKNGDELVIALKQLYKTKTGQEFNFSAVQHELLGTSAALVQNRLPSEPQAGSMTSEQLTSLQLVNEHRKIAQYNKEHNSDPNIQIATTQLLSYEDLLTKYVSKDPAATLNGTKALLDQKEKEIFEAFNITPSASPSLPKDGRDTGAAPSPLASVFR